MIVPPVIQASGGGRAGTERSDVRSIPFYRICIIMATEKEVLKARLGGHRYVLAG